MHSSPTLLSELGLIRSAAVPPARQYVLPAPEVVGVLLLHLLSSRHDVLTVDAQALLSYQRK